MLYLGIDTSNYTTSAAVYDSDVRAVVADCRIPLCVKEGELGLRQSDAVFLHTQNLPSLFSELSTLCDMRAIKAVGVSSKPRTLDGSYMPCFLSGVAVAKAVSCALCIPYFEFSHQQGHVMAAMFGCGFCDETDMDFLAFHVSGGTTDGMLCHMSGKELLINQLCTSLDLFAGQAVDRVGKMLGLGFPAGPRLSAQAAQSGCMDFAKPSLKGGDCCLSGLENKCKKMLDNGSSKADIARYCLVSISKTIGAMAAQMRRQHGMLDFIFAGGVMSSEVIRPILSLEISKSFFCEPASLSSDNAVGIAVLCG
ncbi:MAG: hypothetical protein RSD39_07830, partial [Oscillospiraceae bacterium]